MKDPLTLLTWVVGLALLTVFGRFAFTGDLNKEALGTLATVTGVLVTALSTRKKKEDEDDGSKPK
jgi:ABC-type sulfate transport system permease component